jgi:hypothetical protein
MMRARRRFVFAGVVLLVLGLSGYGAYALFTGAASDSISVSSATLDLSMGLNRLSIDATDMQPGAVVQRAVTINVSGTSALRNANLSTAETGLPSALDSDPTNGLQMALDACDQPWAETLTSGVPTAYTCGGAQTSLFGERPILQSRVAIDLDLTPGASNYLVFTFTLPDTADQSFAGLASTIEFTFEARQRPGGFR